MARSSTKRKGPDAPQSIEDLANDPHNPRTMPPERLESLGASLETFGDLSGLTWNARTRQMVAGHQRLQALKDKAKERRVDLRLEQREGRTVVVLPAGGDDDGMELAFPVRVVDWDEVTQKAANLTANNPGLGGEFVADGVASMLDDIRPNFDENLFGTLRFDEILVREPDAPGGDVPGAGPGRASSSLAEAFLVPPFSVLDARQGYWQERKRAWLGLGIRSEVGRGQNLLNMSDTVLNATAPGGKSWLSLRGNAGALRIDRPRSPGVQKGQGWGGGVQRHDASFYEKKRAWEIEHNGGKEIDTVEFREKHWQPDASFQGTSIFDPVLCELAYRWFAPPGGVVLDPFAGGSVRGIVASRCGRRYVGIDLREEQVKANEEQAQIICAGGLTPRWICGDSQDAGRLAAGAYDFIWTCPPYFDLEVYSEDKRDLSTMSWEDFSAVYRRIITTACGLLKPDRFAGVVVGEVRDKAGAYRNFVGLTVEAFRAAGLAFYNEAILVTSVGSLPIRVRRQFTNGRKLGKTHQNMLIFVKGDAARAVQAVGPVEITGVAFGEEGNDEPLLDEIGGGAEEDADGDDA